MSGRPAISALVTVMVIWSAAAAGQAEDEQKCRARGWIYSYTEHVDERRIVHCRKPVPSPVPTPEMIEPPAMEPSTPQPAPPRPPAGSEHSVTHPPLSLRTGAIDPPSWLSRTWRGNQLSLGAFEEIAVDHRMFARSASAASLKELIDGRDAAAGARSAGPNEKWRYVRDPANPGRVIDMRHFLSIGSRRLPEASGLVAECVQWLWARNPLETAEMKRQMAATAFDPQDFYSNALGAEFFDKHYRADAGPIGEQISRYLTDRGTPGATR